MVNNLSFNRFCFSLSITFLLVGCGASSQDGSYQASAYGLSPSDSEVGKVIIDTEDETSCLPERLKEWLSIIALEFGQVRIVSGHRSFKDNKERGGADGSQHLYCRAADFNVEYNDKEKVPRDLVRLFLANNFLGKGGVGFYCNDRWHLDTHDARKWGGCPKKPRGKSIVEEVTDSLIERVTWWKDGTLIEGGEHEETQVASRGRQPTGQQDEGQKRQEPSAFKDFWWED